ncbi:hypothetical protein NPIL_444011 [Nephila pilipes]|uniref:Uncharacterized protein n=1 Tax=Nephila pilipes TaxID=299642 RepID=A0A8X6T4L5_NEPPI|nr:hypothetical protein NPIL_444011 [Nephila pilipes]
MQCVPNSIIDCVLFHSSMCIDVLSTPLPTKRHRRKDNLLPAAKEAGTEATKPYPLRIINRTVFQETTIEAEFKIDLRPPPFSRSTLPSLPN